MKRVVAAVVIAIAAVVVWWMWPRHGGTESLATTDRAPGSSSSASSASSSSSSTSAPPRHLTRIAPDEHQRIADRIAAAQQQRHASQPGPRPSLPDHTHDLDRIDAPVKQAMTEAIPILAECYDKTGHKGSGVATVMMTLVGDPSVGSLINPDQMTDEAGAPLDPALDRCLRDTFASLELPPLQDGDEFHVQYSFNFADDAKK